MEVCTSFFIRKERPTGFRLPWHFSSLLSFLFTCSSVYKSHPHSLAFTTYIIASVCSKVLTMNASSSATRNSTRRRRRNSAFVPYRFPNILLLEARKRFLTILRPEGPLILPNPELNMEWPKIVKHSFELLSAYTACSKCENPHDNLVRTAMATRVRREMGNADLKALNPAMVEKFAQEMLFIHR
jgi:hypothetical protein